MSTGVPNDTMDLLQNWEGGFSLCRRGPVRNGVRVHGATLGAFPVLDYPSAEKSSPRPSNPRYRAIRQRSGGCEVVALARLHAKRAPWQVYPCASAGYPFANPWRFVVQ